MLCPKCEESVGLIRVEDAKVGSMWQHTRHGCNAILIITASGPGPHLEMREATEQEKAGK